MTRILAIATHATDDPTRASLPFATAMGAIDAKKDVGVVLLGEGTYLAKPVIRESVHGVGFEQLSQMMEQTLQAGVPIYV